MEGENGRNSGEDSRQRVDGRGREFDEANSRARGSEGETGGSRGSGAGGNDDEDPVQRGTSSTAIRSVFLGNLLYDATPLDVVNLFEHPVVAYTNADGVTQADPKLHPIRVDHVDLKRGFGFVFLKDATCIEDKIRAENYVSEINGIHVPKVSDALRAEFARGDGRVKRKEDLRRARISPSETLFVVNFHEETTKNEDLRMLFEPFGKLVRIDMKKNYAFVQFETIEQATRAKDATNGGKLDQSVITVEYVARKPSRMDRGGGGGYRGGRSSYDDRRSGGYRGAGRGDDVRGGGRDSGSDYRGYASGRGTSPPRYPDRRSSPPPRHTSGHGDPYVDRRTKSPPVDRVSSRYESGATRGGSRYDSPPRGAAGYRSGRGRSPERFNDYDDHRGGGLRDRSRSRSPVNSYRGAGTARPGARSRSPLAARPAKDHDYEYGAARRESRGRSPDRDFGYRSTGDRGYAGRGQN